MTNAAETTMRVKNTALDATVTTNESRKDPERGPSTAFLSAAGVITVTVSHQRGVLGRRPRDTTTNGNNGGHYEQ